ncbi:MAG: hypothetical protein U0174_01015 [Polyangiaceae bacterium]
MSARTLTLAACAVSGALGCIFVGCVSDESSTTTPKEDAGTDVGAEPGNDSSVVLPDAGTEPDAANKPDADAGPLTFCATQAKPLAAADFLCADFDHPKLEEGFTKILMLTAPDAGPPTITRIQNEFVSAPNSLLTVPPSGTSGQRGATLEWLVPGAKALTEMHVNFSLNRAVRGGVVAPAAGSVVIARMGDANTTLAFSYADGATVDGTTNYTGYFLDEIYSGSGAIRNTVKLPQQPADNVWTRISLKYAASGALVVLYNDVQIYQGNAIQYTGSSATVRLGAYATGATAPPHNYRFDNATIALFRAP